MNDDELLERLGRVFAPEPVEPPLAGVVALRRAVEAERPQARLAWRPRRVASAAAVLGAVLASSSSAFALTGAPLPPPVRVVAHDVGLPVDSVALADTRGAAARLKDALAHHDPARVDHAARLLRADMAHLDADERGQIEHQTAELLQEANQAGEQDNGSHQNSTGPSSAPPTAPAGPSSVHSGTSGDQLTPAGQGNGAQPNDDDHVNSAGNSGWSGDAKHGASVSQTFSVAPSPAGADSPSAAEPPTVPPDRAGGPQPARPSGGGTS